MPCGSNMFFLFTRKKRISGFFGADETIHLKKRSIRKVLKSGKVDLSRPTWPTVGVFQLFFFHPLPPSPTWNNLAPRSRWNHNELIIHSTIIEQIKYGYCPEESLTFRSFFKISNRWICYWFECFFLWKSNIFSRVFYATWTRYYLLAAGLSWLTFNDQLIDFP